MHAFQHLRAQILSVSRARSVEIYVTLTLLDPPPKSLPRAGRVAHSSAVTVPDHLRVPIYAASLVSERLATILRAEGPDASAAPSSSSSSSSSSPFLIRETAVEQFLMSFAGANFSSVQSRFVLAQVNSIVAFEAWRLTSGGGGGGGRGGASASPNHSLRLPSPLGFYTPRAIRAYFGLGNAASSDGNDEEKAKTKSPRRKHVLEGKEEVLQFVAAVGESRLTPRMHHPSASDEGAAAFLGRTAERYDRADAALTAMYALSRHVNWAVLTGEEEEQGREGASLFEGIVRELLPTVRLGGGAGAKKLQPSQSELAVAAILEQHSSVMQRERLLRHHLVLPHAERSHAGATTFSSEEGGEEGEGEEGGNKAKGKSKKRAKAKKDKSSPAAVVPKSSSATAAAAAAEDAGIDAKTIERTYERMRDAFDAGCRAVLTGTGAGGEKALVAWPVRE
jgi:hypothetical protein